MRNSMTFMNDKFEERQRTFESAIADNAVIKNQNTALKRVCESLYDKVKEREIRITQCGQYSRKRNIEITSFPGQENENVYQIVQKFGSLLCEVINDDDIEVCHRVLDPGIGESMNIVAQFTRMTKRNAVLQRA